MKYLTVKNYERYQHYKHRNPPWIKLYYDLLDDEAFLSLDDVGQLNYIRCLLLASRTQNRVHFEANYLQKVFRSNAKIDLTPLIRVGLLLASSKRTARRMLDKKHENRAQSISSSETETETETEALALARPPAPRGSVYPETFGPDERAEQLALSYGLNVHKLHAAFKDHHRARGTVFKDWQAAFRNWIRNEVKFTQRGQHAV